MPDRDLVLSGRAFLSSRSCSNNFPGRMDGRHVDFSVGDLRERQRTIDGIIDSLLKFTPISTSQQKRKSIENAAAGVNSDSPSSQVKKGRGRPAKVSVPPSSPVPSGSTSGISLDAVVECLNKINDQNKQLLNFVEVLADKVEKNTSAVNTTISQGENPQPIERNAVLEGVTNRIEKIEQNLNSNTLICRGPTVEGLIVEFTAGGSTNLERLKGKVCEAVCGDEITGIDVRDLQASLYGRARKCVRLSCTNPASKIHLLKQARRKKPNGLFVNEFLTSTKFKIYKNLRQLKALHPDKIKAVFTRNGNILYTPSDSNQIVHVSSLADLNNIVTSEVPEAVPEASAAESSANSVPN